MDIHAYTEIRNTKSKKNKWFIAAPFKPMPNQSKIYDMLHLGRDSVMFNQLGGISDGDNELIIDTPRGFPSDCSNEIRKISDVWYVDGHSRSYFTLKELEQWLIAHPTVQFDGCVKPTKNPINFVIKNINDICKLFDVDLTSFEHDNVRMVFWFDD